MKKVEKEDDDECSLRMSSRASFDFFLDFGYRKRSWSVRSAGLLHQPQSRTAKILKKLTKFFNRQSDDGNFSDRR